MGFSKILLQPSGMFMESPNSQFTTAHELGHWIWHRGKEVLICDHDQLTREWTGNNKEVAANRYAA